MIACKDCEHIRYAYDGHVGAYCHLVPRYFGFWWCGDVRKDPDKCGPDAKWFVPRILRPDYVRGVMR